MSTPEFEIILVGGHKNVQGACSIVCGRISQIIKKFYSSCFLTKSAIKLQLFVHINILKRFILQNNYCLHCFDSIERDIIKIFSGNIISTGKNVPRLNFRLYQKEFCGADKK